MILVRLFMSPFILAWMLIVMVFLVLGAWLSWLGTGTSYIAKIQTPETK